MFSRAPWWAGLSEGAETVLKGETAGHRQEQCAAQPDRVRQVVLRGQNGSKLAIGPYWPTFDFKPRWALKEGCSLGQVTSVQGTRLHVVFHPQASYSPPLAFNTCFLSALAPLPVPALPPGLDISMDIKRFEGDVDLSTGHMDFDFDAQMTCKVLGGRLYASEPLVLRTKLTTGEVEGRLFHAVGQRLRNGRAKLVSVANVAASHDWFQATLLGLPTEAFTLMDVSLDFVVE